MENGLLKEDAIWLPYKGQPLSTNNSIHLFKIKVDTHYKKVDFKAVLSKKELEKAYRFLRQNDRESYIISKYFLRILLSKFIHLSATEIEYSYTGNHKPALPEIQFNMSHSENYVLIAISEHPIGIDIEYVNRNFNFSEMMPMCFNQQESSFILNDDPITKFYLLWTRKEALLKATGEGLTDHLNQVPSLLNEVARNEKLFKIDSIKINETTRGILPPTNKDENDHAGFITDKNQFHSDENYLISWAFYLQHNITVTLWDCL